MALLEAAASDLSREARAIENMKMRYARAEKLARDNGGGGFFYAALNRMAAELVVDASKHNWPGFDAVTLDEVRAHLIARTRDDPDFWSVVGLTELRLYQAIAEGKLASELDKIEGEFDDLYARVNAATNWSSVLDQLRFVLPKYQARASARERAAVDALTRYLVRLAGGHAA
jgi:hypothetical protein